MKNLWLEIHTVSSFCSWKIMGVDEETDGQDVSICGTEDEGEIDGTN